MSGAVEEAAHQLSGEVEFELVLGGINTAATRPLGEFGRRHLMTLWREVAVTTGQPFGMKLPDPFVFNSTLPCIAVEAFRQRTGAPPFGFLHRLQQCFFEEGRNIAALDVLDRVAWEFGWSEGELLTELADTGLERSARAQFDSARSYGTSALPNVVFEQDGRRRLLFGGYVDSQMMVTLIRQAESAPAGPEDR